VVSNIKHQLLLGENRLSVVSRFSGRFQIEMKH